MKHVWVVQEAFSFTGDFYVVEICRTKKGAYKLCRDAGFKYESWQDCFVKCCEERLCRTVEKIAFTNL